MIARPQPPVFSAELLLRAYTQGWFPMVHDDGQHYWHDPDPRAVFDLHALRPDRTTRRLWRSGRFRCTVDSAFTDVVRGCAAPAPGREGTWISDEMIAAYSALHAEGHALSVETWADQRLVGGIYGVRLGAAFFGESMFSRASGASRMAFHHLVRLLQTSGFTLFDTQYVNAHTALLGAVEIPRHEFRRRLSAALSLRPELVHP